jgi:hypothetical protein
MKSIIKSIKQTEFSTIITTKSNVVKVYTFSTLNKITNSTIHKCIILNLYTYLLLQYSNQN